MLVSVGSFSVFSNPLFLSSRVFIGLLFKAWVLFQFTLKVHKVLNLPNLILSIFFFFRFFKVKMFHFMLYRLSQLNLRNFKGKKYPYAIMCFHLDGS